MVLAGAALAYQLWDSKYPHYITFGYIVYNVPHIMPYCLWWNPCRKYVILVLFSPTCFVISDKCHASFSVRLDRVFWAVHKAAFCACTTSPFFAVDVPFQRSLGASACVEPFVMGENGHFHTKILSLCTCNRNRVRYFVADHCILTS